MRVKDNTGKGGRTKRKHHHHASCPREGLGQRYSSVKTIDFYAYVNFKV